MVLTRQKDWSHPGVEVIHDWASWAQATPHWTAIGGAAIYALAMPWVERMHLTHVDAIIEGDVYFPDWASAQWQGHCVARHVRDARHAYDFEFWTYQPKDVP